MPEEDDLRFLRKRNVLVIEDSKLIRRMLVNQLKTWNMVVEEAENGKDALVKLEDLELDKLSLIITDILMPELDGAGFVSMAKERYGDKLPPVLVCTTDTDRETVQGFAALGVKGYLIKPFRTDQLIDKLRKVFTVQA